jgi:hypothetical protein
MEPNYLNRFGVVCGTGTDRRILPEEELWTHVILQAIDDLEKRTSLSSKSAQDAAREWFLSDSDAVGSFLWSCQVINVEPNSIRSWLAKKQQILNPNPFPYAGLNANIRIEDMSVFAQPASKRFKSPTGARHLRAAV